MRLFNSLRTSLLAASASLLVSGAGAGPMPTHVAAMKSMAEQNTSQVQWRGGFRGGGFGMRGVGFRGGGWGWRGSGWRGGGWGYRGSGYGVAAGALVGGAIASSAYYGGYGGYYGGYGGYGYPSYSYAAVPYYGYRGGYGYGSYCPPYRGGYAAGYYGW